jgi:glucose/arabinose dehydrogenase
MWSGGGKLLRLDPLTGQAICPGATNAARYSVMNPFCTGNPNVWQSKIWALGIRQSWRMNVRPLMPGETLDGTPGTIYTAEVGEGGFEEINVVRGAGQNFGWPCWEGMLVHACTATDPCRTLAPGQDPRQSARR